MLKEGDYVTLRNVEKHYKASLAPWTPSCVCRVIWASELGDFQYVKLEHCCTAHDMIDLDLNESFSFDSSWNVHALERL